MMAAATTTAMCDELVKASASIGSTSMWVWWMGRNRLLRRISGCNFYNVVPAE
jgi:hypothetical protein